MNKQPWPVHPIIFRIHTAHIGDQTVTITRDLDGRGYTAFVDDGAEIRTVPVPDASDASLRFAAVSS